MFICICGKTESNCQKYRIMRTIYLSVPGIMLLNIRVRAISTRKLEDADLGGLSEKSTPEQEILDNELKKIIELAINSLPEKCRLIFFMVREENMTYKEVAQILSISDRTVHAQMCIAIRKIGIVIQEYRTGKKIK